MREGIAEGKGRKGWMFANIEHPIVFWEFNSFSTTSNCVIHLYFERLIVIVLQ
jgi:hypothetical protein